MPRQSFINIPVKNLAKTREFFSKTGFSFRPEFSDENATCMVIGDNIFAMLLAEKFFKGFIPGREICDSAKSKEALLGIAVEKRAEVDKIVENAIKAGAKEFGMAQNHGWMYGRNFEDLDGHIWEIFHMDEGKMPEEMKNRK